MENGKARHARTQGKASRWQGIGMPSSARWQGIGIIGKGGKGMRKEKAGRRRHRQDGSAAGRSGAV